MSFDLPQSPLGEIEESNAVILNSPVQTRPFSVVSDGGLSFPDFRPTIPESAPNLGPGIRLISVDDQATQGAPSVPSAVRQASAPPLEINRFQTRTPQGLGRPDDKTPPKRSPPPPFGTLGGYWYAYDEATTQYTDELLTGLKENLDNLLIFVRRFVLGVCALADYIPGRPIFGRQHNVPLALHSFTQ